MFHGSIVALVTPFRDGAFDRDACARLVEEQVEGGTRGIVVAGTTGEAPTLEPAEHEEILRFVIACCHGRLPVLAGTGSYSTEETVRRTRAAAAAGADGVLVVAPYYNKPGERGLAAHFSRVADASPVPIVLYNIPSRTQSNITPRLAARLAEHPRVVAIKDASGSPADCMALVAAGLSVLAGDDALTLPWMALGAVGVVSVAANAVPAEMSALVAEAARGDLAAARRRHYRLLPLFRALFVETNPVPVKALLAALGRCTAEVRLPLVEAESGTRQALAAAWREVAEIPAAAAAGSPGS